MVLIEHDESERKRQAPTGIRGGKARRRICLLKGCGKWFRPHHVLARYCSKSCCDRARRWSAWRAGKRYRASDRGKERRRQQAVRYRERVRQRQGAVEERAVCEGHQEEADSEKIPCSRPGCYELFVPERRSPLRKFCCILCCKALRRVRQREAHWKRGSAFPSAQQRWEPFRGPPAGLVRCRIL